MSKKECVKLLAFFALALGLLGFSVFLKHPRSSLSWSGEVYSIEDVNDFDAKLARPYNKALDDFADCVALLTNLIAILPCALVFLKSEDKKSAFKVAACDAFSFGLCWLYAGSVYRILKTFAGRIRPYMYFENPSAKGIAEGDFCRSWPSGHSAAVFIAFAFLLGCFIWRKANSKYKKALLCAMFFLCVLTMLLRMLSGNHFLTDVLSGAVIGCATSFGVFALLQTKVFVEKA